jgi:hypothetical protein
VEAVVNKVDIQDLKLFLAATEAENKKVLSRAINRTLPGVRTDATAEVSKVITATKTVIRKTMTLKKSNAVTLIGLFDSTSKPIALISFGARPVKKGVSVQVFRSSKRSVILHAFKATMGSGHTGIFWRKYSDKRSPVISSRRYGVLPRKYRLPIKELFGPRVTDILDDTKTLKAVMDKAGIRYDKNVELEINYFFQQQKPRFD